MSLTKGVRGDTKAGLVALRDRLAAELDAGPEPKDVASLSGRLLAVIVELDRFAEPVPVERGTPLDDLQRRRAARTAGRKPDADNEADTG